jgi:hypothetical protein
MAIISIIIVFILIILLCIIGAIRILDPNIDIIPITKGNYTNYRIVLWYNVISDNGVKNRTYITLYNSTKNK